jgi:GTP-binding protein
MSKNLESPDWYNRTRQQEFLYLFSDKNMFIDEARIKITSGKGGDGIVHFRREKYVPLGGPDGGDGGKGGDVILEVKPTLNTLATFQRQKIFKAEDGKRGGGNNKTGRSGEDLIIFVSPGTIVYDEETGDMLADMVSPGEQFVVCKGGRAGKGNARFANSRNQTPRIAEKGEPAKERQLRLELRLIADIGIVGVPNAGKSTLLAAVTNAKPKIASYPFTTLEPNLGVVVLDDDLSIVLADIPGLIEGAHMGIGLGHEFLRHIQRTSVLIHILDGLAEDPLLDYAQINSELALFDPQLESKPQIVAFNKIDMPDALERWPELKRQLIKKSAGKYAEPIDISALAKTNLRALLYKAANILAEIPEPKASEELPVYRLESDPQEYKIVKEQSGWRIHGEAIERAAAMTYWEYSQSVRRFQRILNSLGIEEELRSMGVKEGDIVYISEYELEWSD